jgi:hypothetical protein
LTQLLISSAFKPDRANVCNWQYVDNDGLVDLASLRAIRLECAKDLLVQGIDD